MQKRNEYIDKIFNIRPVCFWAFFVVLTIVFCMFSIWAAVAFVLVILALIFASQFLHSKDRVAAFLGSSRVFFVGTAVICICVMISFSVTTLIYSNSKSYAGVNTLNGIVESYKLDSDEGSTSFMTLSGAKFGNKSLNGRVIVFINKYDSDGGLIIGDRISIASAKLTNAKVNDMNVNSGVMYSSSVNFDAIASAGRSSELKFVIWRYSESFFKKCMSPTNATIVYSMLFGDKSTLDGQINSDFKTTGFAQILVVSGLQVGILVGMVTALLKLCKIRKKYQFPIIVAVLLFYCYLCDFRFSVLRASIMFLVLLFNRMYLRRGDLLSSICFAGILTLVIFPYALLSWSFQLSYACMFGIALFYTPVENVLKKTLINKAPKFINSAQMFLIRGLTFYICITVTILPLLIKFFGFIPVFGIITSVFLLPILILSFQGAVLALVTWVGQILLYPINYLVEFVKIVTGALAKVPTAAVSLSNGGYWFVFYFIGLIFCSRFIFLKKSYKYSTAAILFGVYLLGFFL